jgi:hypothetical protein
MHKLDSMAPQSGRMLGEGDVVVNVADLLQYFKDNGLAFKGSTLQEQKTQVDAAGNIALTSKQVSQLTLGVIPMTATEIYLLDEGTGTTATNKGTSGIGNNAILGSTNKWVFGQ